MKDLKSYVIDDESCLRIKFNSRVSSDVALMRYARQKANCPYFRVMKAVKPYTVYRLDFVDDCTYKLVKVGVIE